MTRWPNTRMALARLFANLAICALPLLITAAVIGLALSIAMVMYAVG